MRKLNLFSATVAMTIAMAPAAFAADATLRLGISGPGDPFRSHQGAVATVFESLVETATNGRVDVEVYPDRQLGRDEAMIDQVAPGIVESALISAGAVSQHYAPVGVFDVPFIFPNVAVASRVIDLNSDFGRAFADGMEEATGLKVLGITESGGFFNFSNSERPITSVEDMEGLRMRTMTLPTHQAMIQALGAQATPMAGSEVYTALQTGVVDGAMNPVQFMVFERYHEVQQYLTISNHVITPSVWILNQEFFDGLSPEDQEILEWAAEAALTAGRGMIRLIEASEMGMPTLAADMEVNTIPQEEIEKFAEVTQPAVIDVINEQIGEEGAELLDMLMAEIEAQS